MTLLTRPVLALLVSAFDATGPTERDDVERLRTTLTVALRRCLDAPDAEWPDLVARGAARGGWDEWRVAGLGAAADPAGDPEPEVTRDVLATLVDELVGRRDVLPGPWEGAARQAVVETAVWQAGRSRREVVSAIERAMECAASGDAAGLRGCAERIDGHDVTATYPGLPAALRACCAELEAGSLTVAGRAVLVDALAATPFAAAVARLPAR